jgi:hypothetical protein
MDEHAPPVRPSPNRLGCPYEVVDSVARQAEQKVTTDIVDVPMALRCVDLGSRSPYPWRRRQLGAPKMV